MKKNNKGFSLVELIVVIAIMAVLVGVLAPALLRYVEKSRIQKDASAVAEVSNAIVLACADETVYKAVCDVANSGADTAVISISAAGAITTPASGGTATLTTAVTDITGAALSFASSGKAAIDLTCTIQTNGTVNVEMTSPAAPASGSTESDWLVAVRAAAKK